MTKMLDTTKQMFYNYIIPIKGVIVIENNSVELIEKEDITDYNAENIKRLIYTIRGKQVMLDSDVARLYNYKTKVLNLTVKRNIERFPEEFCFQLTDSELEHLRFQIETSKRKINSKGGRRYLPYAFTEQGIAMLAGVLKSQIAIDVSINIIKTFIKMREFIKNNEEIFNRLIKIESKMLEQDKKFDLVFNELQKDKESEFKQKIFFNGQIYDSYSLVINIIKKAKKKILIIDNYIDDSILDMLTKKNRNVKVTILTSENSNISKLDVQKFNKEYPILEIAKSNKFHDRFIVIDNTEIYHVGASLKDLGKKCFALSKIEDKEYVNKLLEYK